MACAHFHSNPRCGDVPQGVLVLDLSIGLEIAIRCAMILGAQDLEKRKATRRGGENIPQELPENHDIETFER